MYDLKFRRNKILASMLFLVIGLVYFGFAPAGGEKPAVTRMAPTDPAITFENATYRSVAVANAGSITGAVRFEDKYPRPRKIRITKDNEHCGAFKWAEKYIVNPENKGLLNALVTLEGIEAGKAPSPAKAITIAQKGCMYEPHFQVAEIGDGGIELDIENDDGIFHNVHGYAGKETLFNMAHMPEKKVLKQKLTEPGVIALKCDVHPWMNAYIVLLKNKPYYAVTDENGHFEIDEVPPGNYTVRVWHEGLGKMEKPVEVKDGEPADVDFVIKPKKKSTTK